MSVPRGKRRSMLAITALCGLALTGCTQVGNCARAITPAPLVSVDVRAWVTAHPQTNVRVCVDGDCMIGYDVVGVTATEATTPPHDGDDIELTVQPVQGATAVETFEETVPLVHDQCGQKGVWLRMDAAGHLSATRPE